MHLYSGNQKKRTGKPGAGELKLGRRDSHSHGLQLGLSAVTYCRPYEPYVRCRHTGAVGQYR